MRTVEVLVQAHSTPALCHAADRALLRHAPERGVATLHVYDLRDAAVGLGRYHLAPATPPPAGLLHRRHSGGRLAPLGAGFVGFSLVLPHRSWLVADDALALRPEQVLNRCSRGLLAALRALGVDAFYPGRDAITVARRQLGQVGLAVERGGAAVFEAWLAVDGDWSALPALLETVDAAHSLAAAIVAPQDVTALAHHGLAGLALDRWADALAAAYAREFGLVPRPARPPDTAGGRDHDGWIAARRRRAELTRCGVAWGQLGVLDAYLATDDERIAAVLLAGDFLAAAASVEDIEQRLRGCAMHRAAIDAVVDAVCADPHGFLLGVDRSQIADAILAAR